MVLEIRQDSIVQASFNERVQHSNIMQELQLAVKKQDMSNRKLKKEIQEAKMKLVKYAMEIGEIVDRMEDEHAESRLSSQ